MLTCRALEYQPPAQFPVLSGVSVVLTVAHHFPTDCVTLRHATSSVGNPSFSGQGRLRRPTVDLDDGRGPASMASSAQTGSPTDMRLRCTVPRERRSTRLTTSRTAAAVNVPRSPSPVPATGPAFAHPCRQSGGRRRRPHDAWAVGRDVSAGSLVAPRHATLSWKRLDSSVAASSSTSFRSGPPGSSRRVRSRSEQAAGVRNGRSIQLVRCDEALQKPLQVGAVEDPE